MSKKKSKPKAKALGLTPGPLGPGVKPPPPETQNWIAEGQSSKSVNQSQTASSGTLRPSNSNQVIVNSDSTAVTSNQVTGAGSLQMSNRDQYARTHAPLPSPHAQPMVISVQVNKPQLPVPMPPKPRKGKGWVERSGRWVRRTIAYIEDVDVAIDFEDFCAEYEINMSTMVDALVTAWVTQERAKRGRE